MDRSLTKIFCSFLFLWVGLCLAGEPPRFTASRWLERPLAEAKLAAQTYWREAKTNYPSLYFAEPQEQPGRVTQMWMDCAGAPPGALNGRIILTSELGPLIGTRLEVWTTATLPEDAKTTQRRGERTTNVLEGIISVLERKR